MKQILRLNVQVKILG